MSGKTHMYRITGSYSQPLPVSKNMPSSYHQIVVLNTSLQHFEGFPPLCFNIGVAVGTLLEFPGVAARCWLEFHNPTGDEMLEKLSIACLKDSHCASAARSTMWHWLSFIIDASRHKCRF